MKSIDRLSRQGQVNTPDHMSINRCLFNRIPGYLIINPHRFEHNVIHDLNQAALELPRRLISIFELH